MSTTLFRQHDLPWRLEVRKRNLVEAIVSLPEKQVLETAHSVLCAQLVRRFTIDAPTIKEDNIKTVSGDATVAARHRPGGLVEELSRSALVEGTQVTYIVPFTGERQLLMCRPSAHRLGHGLRAACRNVEIVFVYRHTHQKTSEIEEAFEQDLDTLTNYLTGISEDVGQYNDALEVLVGQCVTSRRAMISGS